jgi:hypothetical protein
VHLTVLPISKDIRSVLRGAIDRPPVAHRFLRFTLVSSLATAKDHFLDMEESMTYQRALERALEVAKLRKSVRVIVEP